MDWGKLFLSAEGRIGRQDYWIGVLILFALWIVSHLAHVFAPFIWLLMLYPWVCVIAKRLHDFGKSGWLILIPFVPMLMKRFDVRLIGFTGLALFAASCFMNVNLSADVAGDQFFLPNIVRAVGQALVITPISAITTSGIAPKDAGAASGLSNMMRNLGGAVGTATLATVITKREQYHSNIIGQSVNLGRDEVRARIVHSGAGGITESDISLAEASNAAIIGFNVRANAQARQFAEREGIEIRYYNIIYDLVDDVKAAMSGLLSPERRETFLGNAEILEVFNITKVGKVAGCRVTEGKVERGVGVRLVRDNVVIHEGKLKTLKRFKDEVKEVPAGQECGMAFENYEDIRAGDVIECFRVEQVTRSL